MGFSLKEQKSFNLMYNIASKLSLRSEVTFSLVRLLLCWFVAMISQKVLNRFQPNLDGGLVSGLM